MSFLNDDCRRILYSRHDFGSSTELQGSTMPTYRMYRLESHDRRIMNVEVIEAADDAAALSAARKLLKDHDLEIWTESRRVGELRKSPNR
jgi:hypothetical protein